MAEDMDTELMTDDEAAIAARSMKLTVGPSGVTYYLEPKYGHVRGIVCRRTDGVRVKCPDTLEGGFTDARHALHAVENYINSRGKVKPVLRPAPVVDFQMPAPVNQPDAAAVLEEAARIKAELDAEPPLTSEPVTLGGTLNEDELELEPEPEQAAVINVSEGKPDPEGETVTQRALRERLAGEVPAKEQPTRQRKPRSKQA